LFLSPTPKSSTATTKSTEAAIATAAESSTTTEAITAKSATTAGTIEAAALKTLEPLARKVATRTVLCLTVHITESTTAAAGPIETAFVARSIIATG
jgi:hypothetical protein